MKGGKIISMLQSFFICPYHLLHDSSTNTLLRISLWLNRFISGYNFFAFHLQAPLSENPPFASKTIEGGEMLGKTIIKYKTQKVDAIQTTDI